MKNLLLLLGFVAILASCTKDNDLKNEYVFKLAFNSYNVTFRDDSISEVYMIGNPNYIYSSTNYHFVKSQTDTFKIILPIGVNIDTFYNCTHSGQNIIGYIAYGILQEKITFIRK
jgi:hypothetical protein